MAVVLPAAIASRTCVQVMSSINREFLGAASAGAASAIKATETARDFIGVTLLLCLHGTLAGRPGRMPVSQRRTVPFRTSCCRCSRPFLTPHRGGTMPAFVLRSDDGKEAAGSASVV